MTVGRRTANVGRSCQGLWLAACVAVACVVSGSSWTVEAAGLQPSDASLPELIQPINDFASVIDSTNKEEIDRMIRTLKAATGDVVAVATVSTIEPYADVREYANKLFENHGRGIGDRGKDDGLLIVLAVKQRRVQIEVGYTLEQWITDGFSGETSREYMAPAFRDGRYGDGLRIGTERIIGRIAQGRNVRLDGVRVPVERRRQNAWPFSTVFTIFIILLVISRIGRASRGGLRSWGGSGWSGWSSGVGPFGGGWGGGGGGGGFGGGFGGFGGGRSGGGGGGASW